MAVGKNRKSPRWLMFFAEAVSSFIRQALAAQVATVRGWLESAKDPVLEEHRAGLDTWSKSAGDALIKTRGLATVRGELWEKREELAEGFTRERDALHRALAEHADKAELGRDWADLFFRVRHADDEPAPAGGPEPTT